VKLAIFVTFTFLSMVYSAVSRGAIHQPNKPYTSPVLFFENSQQLVTKQSETKIEDEGVYQSLFQGADGQIAFLYQEQFSQHERNLPFRNSWRGEFISNSINSGRVQYDWQVREHFAKQVLRMRLDQGLREYAKTLKKAEFIAKAHEALESLQNVSVPVASEEGGRSGQLRMGYDLLSDSSRLEYVGGMVDVGVYKNQFLGDMGNMRNTLMNVSSELGDSLGRATVSMPLSAETIQTSLSKQVSAEVATTISSVQPLKANQASSYYWQVAFSF
jgi:hypothetical protein